MNNSKLIVYTFKTSLYCCCFVSDQFMACCSSKAVFLWNFAQGKLICSLEFSQEISPISISKITQQNNNIYLLLQLKSTAIIILTYNKETNIISKIFEYQLQMIGFTKLSTKEYFYDLSQQIHHKYNKYFYMISNGNQILKLSMMDGKILQQYEIDETKLQSVNYMVTYTIDGILYFIAVQEGAQFKQFILPQSQQNIEVNKSLKIPSKQEIVIVLSIQPKNHYQAYVCIRNQNIWIINLKLLQMSTNINAKAFRLIKEIPLPNKEQLYALSSKDQICLFKNNEVKCRQKLQKNFIMDIDTFEFGVIGVTEEGKILLLPLID